MTVGDSRYRMFFTCSDCCHQDMRDADAADDGKACALMGKSLPVWGLAHVHEKKATTAATARIYRLHSPHVDKKSWELVGATAWNAKGKAA